MKMKIFTLGLFLMSFFFFSALNGQDLNVTGTPEVITPGTYTNITIAPGAYGVISGNVTVTNSLSINTGGGLEISNGAVVDGDGSFTMQDASVLAYDGDTLSNSVSVTGVTTLGSNLTFVLTGTGTQNINELPNTVSSIIVNNPTQVLRTSGITIRDSLVIHQGAFSLNGGALFVSNGMSVINHSEEYHNFTFRLASAMASDNIVQIKGTRKLSINQINVQSNRNTFNLHTDLELQNRGLLEKGSHIVLNGNNLIYHSNIWFSGYGDPSYIDYTGGGAVVYPMTGTGSRIVQALLSDGTVRNISLNVKTADFELGGAVELAYSTNAYSDLGGNDDYLNRYLEVRPVNFNSITYDIDFFYADTDIEGNEGQLAAQNYQGGTWIENAAYNLVQLTNNIVCYNLSDTAIISGLTGSVPQNPALIINDTLTLLDTLAAYDSIIVRSGGVVSIGEAFSIRTFIVENGGEVWFGNHVVSGSSFSVLEGALIVTSNTQGFGMSKATTGVNQFIGTVIDRQATKGYNGSTQQNLGTSVANWGALGNIIVDNPAGVKLTAGNVVRANENTNIKFLNGGFSQSNLILEVNGNTTIVNNAAPSALAGIQELLTKGSNDRRTLTIQGDTSFIFPKMGIDKALDIVAETDIQITNPWTDGNSRGDVFLGNNMLVLDMATSIPGTRINFESGSTIKQLVNGAADGTAISYARFYHGGTQLPFSINIESLTERTTDAAILIQNIAGMEPNMRDANNYIGRYIAIDTTDIEEFIVSVDFKYKSAETMGVLASMEAGFYDGVAWDTSNASFDAVALTVTVDSIMTPGSVAVGNNVGLMAPVLVFVSPSDGAIDQAKDVAVYVTFDQNIEDGASINAISITNPNSVAVAGVSGSITDDVLTVDHAPFALTGTYTVTIPAGAVMNADGLGNANPVVWTFDVLLMEAPQAIEFTPEDGTTTENASVVIQVALNQKVTANNLASVTITGPAAVTGVEATIANDSIIEIAHDALTANGDYTVTIPAGTVMNADYVENAEITWGFNLSGLTSIDAFVTNDVQIYPIPAYGSVNVQLVENATITIRNMLGAVVEVIDAKTGLNIVTLNSGIYVFDIENTAYKVIVK